MATVATQVVPVTGLTPAYSAASAGGDKVAPSDRTVLHVKNGSAGAVTVTLVTPGTLQGDLAIADRAVSVAAGAESFIAVTDDYRGSDGLASITWSATASVTFAALRR